MRRAGLLLLLAGLGLGASSDASAKAPREPTFESVAKRFAIELVTEKPTFPVRCTHGSIDGEPAGEKALRDYEAIFAPELSIYPVQLIRKIGLKRIVLCEQLSFEKQKRTAVPDYDHDALYFDVRRGEYSKSYVRRTIHHELFHVLDYCDDGKVYSDPRWEALNPKGFEYGRGGRTMQTAGTVGRLTDARPGFLNVYSTLGVEEDKAEVFATLIVHPAYMAKRAKSDVVLRKKIQRMKRGLRKLCPEMDAKFWRRVQKRAGAASTKPH